VKRIRQIQAAGRQLVKSLSLCWLSLAAAQPGAAQNAEGLWGVVTDEVSTPLKHVRVRLRDKQTDALRAVYTDRQGKFHLFDVSCRSCSLEISAANGSGLAEAVMDNIPGREPRQFVIRLQRGFAITGRVKGGDRPLSGVSVRAVPAPGVASESVHGGGAATTGSHGQFRLILTPGAKELVIVNERYPDFAREFRRPLTVTTDAYITPVELPPIR